MSEPSTAGQNSGRKPKRKMPKGKPWQPGVSGNPGGAPKGKRISTWMVELGQLTQTQLKKAERGLPVNGKIALARIRAAMNAGSKQGNGATEIILDRTEGKVVQKLEGSDGGPLVVQVVSYAAKGAAVKK